MNIPEVVPEIDQAAAPGPGGLVTSRRKLLKAMAVTAAGAAATAVGGKEVLAASPAPSNPLEPPLAPRPTSARVLGPRLPNTPGTSYITYQGDAHFHSRDSATGWSGGSIGVLPVSAPAFFLAPVILPQGVTVTELVYSFLLNDANGVNLYFTITNVSMGTATFPVLMTYTTQSVSEQNVAPAFTPFTVDNTQKAYFFYFGFQTAGATQLLYGARVGWTLNPGLITFPSGHRVWDGYATPVSNGNVYGPITALTEVSTSGWTGLATGVPAGAKAAWCAVQAYSPGVLTLFPDGAADPGGANYAGTGPAGQLNLLYMLVPLSAAGKFAIHSYFTGQVFVDVWGYQV